MSNEKNKRTKWARKNKKGEILLPKPILLEETLHDDFLKVCSINDHDFVKRVRFLIKRDVAKHKELNLI